MSDWKLRRVPTGSPALLTFELGSDYLPEYRQLVYKAQKVGDWWRVGLEPWKNRRSTGDQSQNHHLNGHCMQIANETGNDFADVKMFVKRSAMKFGLPARRRPDGSIVYSLADGEPVPISESEMNTEQCAWCIECAHMVAGELGIILREG